MKIYLAGPMRDETDYNYRLFFEAAALLTMKGHDVVNPAHLDIQDGHSYWSPTDNRIVVVQDWTIKSALRRDFHAITLDREAIVLLPGWEGSYGANKELHFADVIGLEVYTYVGDGELEKLSGDALEPTLTEPTGGRIERVGRH